MKETNEKGNGKQQHRASCIQNKANRMVSTAMLGILRGFYVMPKYMINTPNRCV